ncbi:MAG: hypothetical protein E2P02_04645 [Acidobacteria bacterium]|nr:MAG: hypothetical protein E2P02_04645 [Acidobacteriota bacterium]
MISNPRDNGLLVVRRLARRKLQHLELGESAVSPEGGDEAHEHGWHRGEMCPSDILLEESDVPRLSSIDFSNVLREQSMLTGNFLIDRESICYMSPERYFGQARTKLTDQYSLGLIATELLAGPRLHAS